MRVLVTGGAGYIGSHTVNMLRDRGDFVIVIDNLENGNFFSIPTLKTHQGPGRITRITGNICQPGLVADALFSYGIDAVIHFAGYKFAGESMDSPGKYFENNVQGTRAVLNVMAKGRHNKAKRFVFSSSCAVYGWPASVQGVHEGMPLNPVSPYGESKLMCERMLPWFGRLGVSSMALRYFNAAGAMPDGSNGEDPKNTHCLIPQIMKAAISMKPPEAPPRGFREVKFTLPEAPEPVKIFGTDYPTPDGTAIRDYVHVLDLASAHIKALDYLMTAPANPTPVAVNLGSGKGTSVKEVLTAAERVTGLTIPVVNEARRVGDPDIVYADTSKAQSLLKWTPQYKLDDMLSSAWAWTKAHPKGFKQSI